MNTCQICTCKCSHEAIFCVNCGAKLERREELSFWTRFIFAMIATIASAFLFNLSRPEAICLGGLGLIACIYAWVWVAAALPSSSNSN